MLSVLFKARFEKSKKKKFINYVTLKISPLQTNDLKRGMCKIRIRRYAAAELGKFRYCYHLLKKRIKLNQLANI